MRIHGLEGRGKAYDDEGVPILNAGEQLLAVIQDKNTVVFPGWGKYWIGGKLIFSDQPGNGTFYLTDERIVFTRKPDPWSAGKWLMNPVGFASGVDKVLEARRLVKGGGYEFLEIEYGDIAFYRKSRGRHWLLLCVDGRKCQSKIPEATLRRLLPIFRNRGIPRKR